MEKLLTFCKDHPVIVFWIRFVLWVCLAAVLPFAFIAWRYGIFEQTGTMALSGWGIIAILIAVIFVLALISYIRHGVASKNILVSQCISGFCKVILPLIIVLLVVKTIKDNVALFEQAISCVVVCEFVAIPINPMPKWAHDNQKEIKEEERKSTVDYLIDKFFTRKGEDK